MARYVVPTTASTSVLGVSEQIFLMGDSSNDAWWTARTSDTGTVVLLRPKATNDLDDLKGLITSWTQDRLTSAAMAGRGMVAYSNNSDPWRLSPSPSETQSLGNVIVRTACAIRAFASEDMFRAWEISASGETEATNFLVDVGMEGMLIRAFHESGAGDNHSVKWDTGAVPGDILYFVVVRVTIGGGDCEYRCFLSLNGAALTQLNVDSVVGLTDNTTLATGSVPSGGTATEVRTCEGFEGDLLWTFVHVLETTTTLAAEQAVLDAISVT